MANRKPAKSSDGWVDVPVPGASADDGWEDVPLGNASQMRASAAKGQGLDLMKKFNETGNKMTTPGYFKDALAALTGGLDVVSLRNLEYSPKFKQALDEAEMESPTSTSLGKGAGEVGLMAGSAALPGGPFLKAGLQGLLTKPQGEMGAADDLSRRGLGAGFGVATAGAMEGAGAAMRKSGDWAMQKAVNMRQYVPGMGNRIADEGLWGWRGKMARQIESKLPAREAELDAAVSGVRGSVPPGPAVNAINQRVKPYIPEPGPSGPLPLPSGSEPFVSAGGARAAEAAARGNLAPEEAISVARSIAKPAYNKTGAPLDTFKHQLSQSEAAALKEAVKEMADAQGKPGVRKALGSEQALINARSGLARPESVQELLRKLAIRGGVGAGLGYAINGQDGATTGGAIGAAASTPIGMSSIGQLGTKAGGLAPKLTPAMLDAILRSYGGAQ